MASETFHLKQGATQSVWAAVGLCFIGGIAFFALAGPVSEQAGDMSPQTARLVMYGLGVLLILIGAYYVYAANQTRKRFLTLSDEGINLDDRWIFAWKDIEHVEEEDIPIKAKGVTVTTKYRLWIHYRDQREQKVNKTAIPSDFEGYDFLKARIMSKFGETHR